MENKTFNYRFVFVILMSTISGEKDSLLGQTVLPPELGQFFGGLVFFTPFRSDGPVFIFLSGHLVFQAINDGWEFP